MFENVNEYQGAALVQRLYARVEGYEEDKLPSGHKLHIISLKQIHGKYAMLMDWQYKVKLGEEPSYMIRKKWNKKNKEY